MKFRNLVKKHRKELDLRQVDLAKELGVNQVTIGDYERGKSFPEPARLVVLTKKLGFSFEEASIMIAFEKGDRGKERAEKQVQVRLSVIHGHDDAQAEGVMEEEEEFIHLFHSLTPSHQNLVRELMRALAE